MGVADLRDVTQADVYKQGTYAATLTRTYDGVRFEYTPDYLARNSPPVASTLPLTDEPHLSTPGAVPSFFANLLPEGRRLSALRRRVKTSADDELSLLLAVGADAVGDVQVVPRGQDPTALPGPAIVAERFDEIEFSQLLAKAALDPAALAGAQDKVSGRMITIPMAHRGRGHLLKLTPPEYPRLVENEAFFLNHARRMKSNVVSAEIVRDAKGAAGLLVERFDRALAADGALRRLAVEDAAQLLDRYPGDKYTVSAEQVAAAVARAASSRPLALQGLVRQLAFAWITGNGDQHAKNFSVVTDHTTTLAPIYDIPSTVPYGDHTLALSVQGQRKSLSRRRLLAFADEVGLPAAAAHRAIDDAVKASDGIEDEIADGAIGFDAQRARDLVRTVRRRRTTMEA